jgi:carboxyl-terminal processing protease
MRLLPLFLAALASLPALAENPRIETFDECWGMVKKRIYDKKMNGRDWDALREQYRPLAEKAETQDELIAITNRMLGELKLSHLVWMSKDAYEEHLLPEMGGEAKPAIGFEAIEIDGKLFVRSLFEGGPAEKAGIRRGDRLVKINGVEAKKSKLLALAGSDPGLPWPPLWFVEARKKPVALTIESKPGETREVSVQAEPISGVVATKNSVRTVKYKGMTFGYVHTWHFLVPDIYGTVSNAMKKEWKSCDGLLLDIRGRGGSPLVMNAIMGLFRTGAWSKPVVLLVDDRSRSAKEIFTHNFMKENLGPTVGRTTEGAVLGSQFFKLKDGSCVLIPVQDAAFYTKGVRLEGKGVTPHLVVEHPLPYANGYDEILEFGKARLEMEVRHTRKKAKAVFLSLFGIAA